MKFEARKLVLMVFHSYPTKCKHNINKINRHKSRKMISKDFVSLDRKMMFAHFFSFFRSLGSRSKHHRRWGVKCLFSKCNKGGEMSRDMTSNNPLNYIRETFVNKKAAESISNETT